MASISKMSPLTKTPLVTISIINYNYAEYVGKAIESALGQSYMNVEVTVIDDGSTDGSLEVINQYKDKVKIVTHSNRGVIYVRNEAIGLANGEYQLQLDADDELHDNFVEECIKAALNSDADIVYTQAELFGRVNFVTEFPDFSLDKLKLGNYIHASSMVRTSIIKQKGYDQNLNDKGYEDWDLFLDICLDGSKALLVDKPLLRYRKHTDQKSRSDKFDGTLKEVSVRHYILTKQLEKHPLDMKDHTQQASLMYSIMQNIESYQKLEKKLVILETENKLISDQLRAFKDESLWECLSRKIGGKDEKRS